MILEKLSISHLIFGIILTLIGIDFLLKDLFGIKISLIELLFQTSAIKILTGIFLIYLGLRNFFNAFNRKQKKQPYKKTEQ